MNECPVCDYEMEDTGVNYVCPQCGHTTEDYKDSGEVVDWSDDGGMAYDE